MATVARILWTSLAVIIGIFTGWALMAYLWNILITGPI